MKNSWFENFSTLKITAYVNMASPNVSSEALMGGTTGQTSKYVGTVFYRGPYSERPSTETDQSNGRSRAFGMSKIFDRMYSNVGRRSVAPEKILKSLLLMALYSVRRERQFCEQMGYNLLFRWFLDMELEEDRFDATVFSKNRDRLMEHEVGRLFFEAVVGQARGAG